VDSSRPQEDTENLKSLRVLYFEVPKLQSRCTSIGSWSVIINQSMSLWFFTDPRRIGIVPWLRVFSRVKRALARSESSKKTWPL